MAVIRGELVRRFREVASDLVQDGNRLKMILTDIEIPPSRVALGGPLEVAWQRAIREAIAQQKFSALVKRLREDYPVRDDLVQIEALLREPGSIAESPFPGLAPFDEDHAAVFFGREGDYERVTEKLGTDAGTRIRWLHVTGVSAAGKSSFVHACLIPRVRAEGLSGRKDWRVAVMQPGHQPVLELTAALGRAFGVENPSDLLGLLQSEDPRARFTRV